MVMSLAADGGTDGCDHARRLDDADGECAGF